MKKRRKLISSTKGKVRNATPTKVDGIQFKSKLEAYTYIELKKHNIPTVGYENTVFTILDSFKYDGKTVRKMTYTPDFVGDDFVIECKGFPNDAFPLRWKIFQYFLFMNKLEYKLYMPTNTKEVDEMIKDLVSNGKSARN